MAEEERISWRNKLLEKKIKENEWYTHPTFTNYEANTNGEVRNKTLKHLIEGSSNSRGRTTISIEKKKKQKHRIIMECLYETTIPEIFDIDHKDKNAGNNLFSNLQILTRKEHCKKTAETCPERGKKAARHTSKKIICEKNGEKQEFNSIAEAKEKLGITPRRIRRSIQNQIRDSEGFLWSEILNEQNSFENEIWKELKEISEKLFVSNKGRVWFQYQKNPYKTFGSFNEDNYRVVSVKGTQYRVHTLIALAFIGPQPSPNHSVDHIDRNNQNNDATNLRWATKEEQANNRTNIQSVEVYNILTQEVLGVYKSQRIVAQTYNVKESVVYSALQFPILNSTRGYGLGSHKNLSVRYANLTKEEKKERELTILNHDLEVLQRDKNKRKSNPENLPIHITKTTSSYVLTMTFRGEKKRYCSVDLNKLNSIKNFLLQTWRKKYEQIILNLYELNPSISPNENLEDNQY